MKLDNSHFGAQSLLLHHSENETSSAFSLWENPKKGFKISDHMEFTTKQKEDPKKDHLP